MVNSVKFSKYALATNTPGFLLFDIQLAGKIKSNLANEFVNFSISFGDINNVTVLGTTGARLFGKFLISLFSRRGIV